MPFTRPISLDAALARLMDGNARFVQDRPTANVHSALRIELASGQSPFAVILGCSDSRVPIETIFDQQPGNLFVVRVAGNIVNIDSLASIEYAVEVLRSMLVLVLGHSSCGAVAAAAQHVEFGTNFNGHIQYLADTIAPAVRKAKMMQGDWLRNAVDENVRQHIAELLDQSSIINEAVARGEVRVAGAVYDLHSGAVELIDNGRTTGVC
ncbi:MAG: carbonic anhydrase [Vulcanimicrobiaceae bacterium]